MAFQHLTVLTVLLFGLEDVSCKYLTERRNELEPKQSQSLDDNSAVNIDNSNSPNSTDNNSEVFNDNPPNSLIERESMDVSYRSSPIININTVSKSGQPFKTNAPLSYNPYPTNSYPNYYYSTYTPAPAPSVATGHSAPLAEYPITRPYLDTHYPSVTEFLADESNSTEDIKEKEDDAIFSEASSLEDVVDLDADLEKHLNHQHGEIPIHPHHTLPAPPVLTGLETYNMEGSEIGEATYIIPDELKGSISEPPPEPAQRTYGLTVNDGQVVRNEVRNDFGEFYNSYITADGTRRTEIGELVVQPNGAKVLILRGSYTYRTPNGKRYQVIYKADTSGYHVKEVPLH